MSRILFEKSIYIDFWLKKSKYFYKLLHEIRIRHFFLLFISIVYYIYKLIGIIKEEYYFYNNLIVFENFLCTRKNWREVDRMTATNWKNRLSDKPSSQYCE